MKVNELIEVLKNMPEDSEVFFFGADNHMYDTYKVINDEDTIVIFEDEHSEDNYMTWLNFFKGLAE